MTAYIGDFVKTQFARRNKSDSEEYSLEIEKVKVRNDLLNLLREHLDSPGDILEVKVVKSGLEVFVEVVSSQEVLEFYNMVQVSSNVFQFSQRVTLTFDD